jgi:S-adenosylmethionine uptake transporter
MAWFVFKDAPTRRTWLAIGIGFIGMLIIARPDTLPLDIATLLAFVWIFFGAINVMFVRSMPKDHPNIFTVYTHTSLLLAVSIFAIPHIPEFRMADALYPLTSGAAAALAGYLFYNAYRLAPSSLVAPTQYTQIVWGALAGWFVFDSTLTVHLFIGAVFIMAAGWMVLTQSHSPASAHTLRRANRGFGIRFSPEPVKDVEVEEAK